MSLSPNWADNAIGIIEIPYKSIRCSSSQTEVYIMRAGLFAKKAGGYFVVVDMASPSGTDNWRFDWPCPEGQVVDYLPNGQVRHRWRVANIDEVDAAIKNLLSKRT